MLPFFDCCLAPCITRICQCFKYLKTMALRMMSSAHPCLHSNMLNWTFLLLQQSIENWPAFLDFMFCRFKQWNKRFPLLMICLLTLTSPYLLTSMQPGNLNRLNLWLFIYIITSILLSNAGLQVWSLSIHGSRTRGSKHAA